MIGLVIVTHGDLAIELKRATEHVVGPQNAIETICIGPDDDIERRRDDIRKSVDKVDSGRGVILLTDMFGGTPSNLAHSNASFVHRRHLSWVALNCRLKKNIPATPKL